MTDNTANDDRLAAKQDLTELLIDILIPPFKHEISTILEENLYPLEKNILDKQERLETQAGRVARFIAKHYPEHSPPLEEQLQGLQFAQQDADALAQARNTELFATLAKHTEQAQVIQHGLEGLSQALKAAGVNQAATQDLLQHLIETNQQSLGQLSQQLSSFIETQQHAHAQALQALQALGASVEGRLDDHLLRLKAYGQALSDNSEQRLQEGFSELLEQLRGLDKEGRQRLEKFMVVTASQQRTVAQNVALAQDQHVQTVLAEQANTLRAQHEAYLQSLNELQLNQQAQQACTVELKSQLDISHKQLKRVLYGCAGMVFVGVCAVMYLVLLGR
ncbi:hypothetical protein KC131_16860 [Pseudomonas sp. JQ170]|uniref:hypothetical protein n=1 Tax=unclassified Pseudomonas TaxID=196821 RepID=UPI002656F768|nr:MULTISPECIES: hypothetical protein [unclassified Pseudomonas]MDN7142318.1 hypothetical protein [Pseudomonas sp. JQ170]WRO76781.1 hypothetical protein U9R80_03610 [Pseudomonas sp. 170C]